MNSIKSFPTTTKTNNNPEIKDYGISISVVINELGEHICYGVLAVPLNHTGFIHKSIVMTINSSGRFSVTRPFKDTMLFDDDTVIINDSKVGYFQLNLMEYLDITIPGDYYVICSSNSYLSDIESFNIT